MTARVKILELPERAQQLIGEGVSAPTAVEQLSGTVAPALLGVDQARAASVLIELENGRPVIVDRALYRELVKGAIIRTVADLQAKATAAAEDSCDFPTRRIRTGPATMAESVWS